MYEVIQNTNNDGLREIATAGAWLVYVKKNGRLERAKHLGKRGGFDTREDAERAVYNAVNYGAQNV